MTTKHMGVLLAFGAVMLVVVGPASGAGGYKHSVLHSFCSLRGCKDGTNPGGILLDASGNIFGVSGGAGPHHGSGAVWELIGGRKFKVLYGFCAHNVCSDGKNPGAAPILDVAGNLYGTTTSGTVFELSPGDRGWSFHLLYEFCSQQNCSDGQFPSSGLTYAGAATGAPYDGTSPLYGTTDGGGANGKGVVYQLTPNGTGWSESVVYSFCNQGGSACTDGARPGGGVLVDPNDNLFGTTTEGGTNHLNGGDQGAGTLYELVSSGDSWAQTVLYNFCAAEKCTDGGVPASAPIQDSAGNLYGTTTAGGRSCRNPALAGMTCGVVYKLVPNGAASQETILYQFCSKSDCADGAKPIPGLLMDASGNLFGTTYEGGGNDEEAGNYGGGVAFELSGNTLHVLYRFCAQPTCTDGWQPLSNLVMDPLGDLFGTTNFGGDILEGTIFKLKPKQ